MSVDLPFIILLFPRADFRCQRIENHLCGSLNVVQKALCVHMFIGRKDERQADMLLRIQPKAFQNQIGCTQNGEFSKALFFQTGHPLHNGIHNRFLCPCTENLSQGGSVFFLIKRPDKASHLWLFRILCLTQIVDIGNMTVICTQYRHTLRALLQLCAKSLPQRLICIGTSCSGRMEKERYLS